MSLLLRVFVVALLCVFVGVSTVPPASAAVSRREAKLFRKINRARVNHGRKPLDLSLKISRMARNHSERMAREGRVFHSCLTCKFAGWNWDALAENVASGPGVKAVHRKMMRSSTHRANILGRQYRRVGVGIVRARGKLWVTEIFYG